MEYEHTMFYLTNGAKNKKNGLTTADSIVNTADKP